MVMIYYGWPKIRDLGSNANDFVRMGFKPGMFWGTLIASVEFFGGLAILLGFYAELPLFQRGESRSPWRGGRERRSERRNSITYLCKTR
jgi:hypothetical protein